MWWPGGGGGAAQGSTSHPEIEEDPGSSSSEPEVMEILSEEDLSASPPLESYATPGGHASQDPELKDLKDQFLRQEQLLGQLKGVLKSNQDKLHGKEREVQDYAARLAQLRHRPLHQSSPIAMAGAGPQTPEAGTPAPAQTTGTGKIRLLKKQLEEARMKESEDNERLRDLEGLVKDLHMDITDRDKMIQRMKEDQYSIASYRESPPGSPFIMSPGPGSPGDM
eukprot:snap_masked-scaffold1246_size53250-processed-gene-0.5 protein:Tk08363 transcript:snap_masked-scaffold1246_size53250-processed-gene-0.5-mRNA-1 annotation:"hypothetical protein PIIN_05284"